MNEFSKEPLETWEGIIKMMDLKRSLMYQKDSIQPVVLMKGFFDTASGLCLTSSGALDSVTVKDQKYVIRRAEKGKRGSKT